MSDLKIYDTLTQGTDEWLQARAGILTASVVGQLLTTKTLTVSKSDTARQVMDTLVAQRITGQIEEVYPTRDMERGTAHEPFARDLYAQTHGVTVDEVGFMTRTIGGHTLGYSPDGLVGEDGLIEIKSRRAKKQLRTILTDTVPIENYAQLQAGLMVSGRAWIDYVSVSEEMPMYVKRVYPELEWQVAITEALAAYEEYAAQAAKVYASATEGAPIFPRVEMDILY